MPLSPFEFGVVMRRNYNIEKTLKTIDDAMTKAHVGDDLSTVTVTIDRIPAWIADEVVAAYRSAGWKSVEIRHFDDQRESGTVITLASAR